MPLFSRPETGQHWDPFFCLPLARLRGFSSAFITAHRSSVGRLRRFLLWARQLPGTGEHAPRKIRSNNNPKSEVAIVPVPTVNDNMPCWLPPAKPPLRAGAGCATRASVALMGHRCTLAHHSCVEVLDETFPKVGVNPFQPPLHALPPVLQLERVLARGAHTLSGTRAVGRECMQAGR